MCMTALMVAAGGFTAMSAYQQSKQQKAQAEYQAMIARRNKEFVESTIPAIEERNLRARKDKQMQIVFAKGDTRSVFASRGVLVDDVDATVDFTLQDIAQWGEYDILKIKDQADLQIRELLFKGQQFQAEADLNQFEADSISPMMSFMTSAISSAATGYVSHKMLAGGNMFNWGSKATAGPNAVMGATYKASNFSISLSGGFPRYAFGT